MNIVNAPLNAAILNLLQGQLESLILSYDPFDAVIEEQYLLCRLGLKLQTDNTVSDDSARFQKHFILYHLLFRLQSLFIQNKTGYLSIGMAKVQLLPMSVLPEKAADNSKADYYLSWQNYYQMTDAVLDEYLNAFWQQYVSQDKAESSLSEQDAKAILNLDADFTLFELKKAYRAKALLTHPDRGGQMSEFILVRQAYQVLLALF